MPLVDKMATFEQRNPEVLTREIGQRLRRLRLAAGWSQAELAERAGVSLSTLKLMEQTGKGALQRLARIAVALNVDGELRALFLEPRQVDDLGSVERMQRKRAPRRRKDRES
jgi:transcriptional regulator with XRE-family HTH domain